MIVSALEGKMINDLRAALMPLHDAELEDERARSLAYRDAGLDHVLNTMQRDARIWNDAWARRLERTRRRVINDPRNWQLSGLARP